MRCSASVSSAAHISSSTTRASPISTTQAARVRRGHRRRSRPPAHPLHPPHQRGACGTARRDERHHPHVPGATSARPGSPRAVTTSSPKRSSTNWRSTGSSWSTTTPVPAASSRCDSCRRERWSCWGSSPPSGRARREGRVEAPDRGRLTVCAARPALSVAAVRVLIHGRGQHARQPDQQVGKLGSMRRPRRSGAEKRAHAGRDRGSQSRRPCARTAPPSEGNRLGRSRAPEP